MAEQSTDDTKLYCSVIGIDFKMRQQINDDVIIVPGVQGDFTSTP